MGNIDKSLKDLFSIPKNTLKLHTLSVMESITPRSFLRWNRHPSGSASPIIKNFNLKKFGGKNDWDGDGVPNKKDCQPRNTMRQDFTPFRRQEKAEDMTAARRFGGANLQRLQKIGSGRDRVIYALDKDKVIKIAKNPGGLTQNQNESYLEALGQLKHYETGKDYAVMQRADKPGKATTKFLKPLKKAVSRTVGPIIFRAGQKHPSVISQDFLNSPEVEATLDEDEQGLFSDLRDYGDFNPGEMIAKRQWGEVQGKPMLIDAGSILPSDSLKRSKIKDFQQLANLDKSRSPPWQLKEWNEVQQQRRQFKKKGKIEDKELSRAKEWTHSPETALYWTQPIMENMEGRPIKIKESISLASPAKQQEWQNKSEEEKIVEHITEPDTDGDNVPDEYDCEPENPEKQDKFTPKQMKELQSINWKKNQKGQMIGEGHVGKVYEVKDNPNYVLKVKKSYPWLKKIDEYGQYEKSKNMSLIAPVFKTPQGIVREKMRIITRDPHPKEQIVDESGFEQFGVVEDKDLSHKQLRQIVGGVDQLSHHGIYFDGNLQIGVSEKNKKPYIYDIDDLYVSKETDKDIIFQNNALKRDFLEKIDKEEYYKPYISSIKQKHKSVLMPPPILSASSEKQQEWQDKSNEEKAVERITEPDTDGDNVPDEYDCEPENPDKDMAFKKSTDTPISNYPDSFGYRGKVVYGTPDEFMLKTKKEHLSNLLDREEGFNEYKKFRDMPIEQYEDIVIHKSNLPRIKEGLQNKKPLVPIGWLETNRGKYVGHEGRHRAVAAKQLGIKTIPWIEVESDKGYIDEENIQSDIFEPNKNVAFIDNEWVVDSPEEIQAIIPAEEIEEEEDDEELRQKE